MPIHLDNIKEWDIYYGEIEICDVYRGLTLIRNCAVDSTVSSNSAFLTSTVYPFTTADFTKDFSGGTHKEVFLKTLPAVPALVLLGTEATVNDSFGTISASGLKFVLSDRFAVYDGVLYRFAKDLSILIAEYEALGYRMSNNALGKLTFINQADVNDIVILSGQIIDNELLTFEFVVSNDMDGLTNKATFSLIPQGDINIKGTHVNQPATIGDITITVDSNKTTVITMEMITEQSAPPYNDPEKDLIDAIRTDLIGEENVGTFFFNNVPIFRNQVISREDIIQGLFKHVGVNIDDIKTDTFKMSIRDEGSQKWVS